MFLRGVTDGRTTDPNGGALTAQALAAFVDDGFESHTHTYTAGATSSGVVQGGVTQAITQGATAPGSVTSATGGTETEPKNIGITYCIQY
jgi:hypothetical protein